MTQISSLKNPTNVLIVVKQNLIELSSIAGSDGNYFYLDNIQDPGNVGTIIRLADWFGFKGVIASTSTADFFNPKVVQATMGSIVGPALIEAPISHLSSYLPLYQIYGMEMTGVALSEADFSNRNIIILGNEGHGLSHEAKSLIKEKNYLTIPGFDCKIAESLNVSVAAGILAHHLYQLKNIKYD
jgi:TrmH family RNA methyltransferase